MDSGAVPDISTKNMGVKLVSTSVERYNFYLGRFAYLFIENCSKTINANDNVSFASVAA